MYFPVDKVTTDALFTATNTAVRVSGMTDWDDGEIDLLEESRRLIADLEDTYVNFVVGIDSVSESLQTALTGFEEIATGSVMREVGMDDPIKIEDAVFLPELGGVLTVDRAYSLASTTHAVKTIRAAISSGMLRVEKPNGPDGKKQLVTRNFLKEYRTACQERPNPRASCSVPPVTTPQGSSRTKPNGASTTDLRELTRAAALKTLQGLKRS